MASRLRYVSSLKVPKRTVPNSVYENEYTSKPNYPPILDLSRAAKKQRLHQDNIDYIKNIKTVEEKMIKFNMPKYYGFKTCLLSSSEFSSNNLPFIQRITKTALLDELPDIYSNLKEESASITENIKSQVLDVLHFEHDHKRWKYDHMKHEYSRNELDDIFAKSIVEQINRIIMNSLAPEKQHLLNAQIDIGQKINSFWTVGGFQPPKEVRKSKEAIPHLKEEANLPFDRHFVFQDSLALNLRHNLPLPIFKDLDNLDLSFLKIPKFDFDPRVLGYKIKRKHLTSIPGYWPGEASEFSFLSYNTSSHLNKILEGDDMNYLESIQCQGIITQFAYLMAQCFYLGFSTLNELTYPLTTQTVITDGRLWSIFAYQLNTVRLDSYHIDDDSKKNICWGIDRLPLFENFVDGKIIGFNEETLQQLVKLYLITPQQRPGVDLRPNLGLDERYIADISDEERRIFLERIFTLLPHGQRSTYPLPEIYDWEKIYKIDNKTRPMEPKRRPFELGISPYSKRLDDEHNRYVPKELRKPGRGREKFERTFWP